MTVQQDTGNFVTHILVSIITILIWTKGQLSTR